MGSKIGSFHLTLVAACLMMALAPVQEPKTTTRDVLVSRATVDRIDRFARSVTLRTNEGLLHTVYVGPELKVFDGLKTGDTVTARIVESIVVAVRPNAKPSVITDTTAEARRGSTGRGDVQQQLKATVTVQSVDVQKQVITYRTADNRNVIRPVMEAHLLEGLKPGDIVEVTFTRERAIELERTR